jgi:bifunctional UDP-N-acetylglucosamine pyrophosphorylase/glucosamine-1-phosphate N-acetyltransferase
MSAELIVTVLAAGEGKRMRSMLPKVLHRIGGDSMLGHVLSTARALSPSRIQVVYGHGGDAVRAAFAAQPDLDWVHQPEQRGTGHAVQLALPDLPDEALLLVLYGDVPLLRSETLRGVVIAAESSGAAVLVASLADPTGYGRVLLTPDYRVLGIVEHRDASPEQRRIHEVNTGIVAARVGALRRWLARLRPDNAQGELYLTDIFAMAAAEGHPAHAVFLADAHEAQGANDPWQLAELERLLQRRQARALCEVGVRLRDPARFDQRGTVQAGRDVEIDLDVILEGTVVLGEGVKIGPYCRLKDCRLAAGTEVAAHCDLEGVVSTGACRIGPFARLRPGTELACGVHIGNFVEVKAGRFATGAKANHLSYIGDAEIGERVNIGAGTITCNYDGANKHRTVIGAEAFIGSNSALVAPVTIGAGATIGAGSVISKSAPAGQLTLTRASQQTLAGWKRPTKADH